MFSSCTRGTQTLMSPNFYFMLFRSLTSESFPEPHYNIAEGIVIFQYCLHLFQQSFYTFDQKHVFPHSKSWFPSSAATGSPCSVVIILSSQADFFVEDQRDDNLMFEVRTLGWMWEHCTSETDDGLCLLTSWKTNNSDIFLAGQTWQRQAFILLRVSV